jgi:hypothetical protein
MSFALAGLVGVLALGGGGDDLVVLKDGQELHGRVVFEDEGTLVLRQGTGDTTLERDQVEHVESRLRNLGALLDNDARAKHDRRDALELLAAQATEMGLAGEAQVFWLRMLLLGGDDAAAHRALGHSLRGRAWVVPLDRKHVPWEQRIQLASDWGSAWQCSSLHYELRSNLSLLETLDALLDLERLYRAFYEVFGVELGLYEVCEPMRVHLHADSASYPETAREVALFDPGDDTVRVKASEGFDFRALAHEATHQLLYDTVFRARKQSGRLPAWLDEGLAEYVSAGVERVPGLVFKVGRPEAEHFRVHRRALEPFPLARVLSFSASDYEASSERKQKFAQSYTLVYFLMHGAKGRYRAGFFDYLRLACGGGGTGEDLVSSLRADMAKLDAAWQDYVSNMQ